MKRPNIPDDIYETVQDEARDYDNSWHQTLERILEQKAGLEIKQVKEVEA